MAAVTPIPVDEIATTIATQYLDVMSSRLGTRALAASDEFFCSAANLTNPLPPEHRPNTYTPAGAWYDGWETRRHNPAPADWAVFRLGVRAARVAAVEVDTGFFSGNHAPEVALEGAFLPSTSSSSTTASTAAAAAVATADTAADDDDPTKDPSFPGWTPILPRQPCGPACRQAWRLPALTATPYTHLRLLMYPDGGIGRLRVYGLVEPAFSSPPPGTAAASAADASDEIDLASALNGGRATSWSDQHFGTAANLLLPGRGTDMSDGWETKRSRGAAHTDWAVVRLGAPAARVSRVVVDTAHFKGNFPREVIVYAAAGEAEPQGSADEGRWKVLVPRAKCRAHWEHEFPIDGAEEGVRWVKLEIIPDGGVKRLRVYGRLAW